MYGKPAMTWFKYQVVLYGSEAITYFNAILWVVIELALCIMSLRLHTPPLGHYRQPSPPLYGSTTFTHLEENSE
jgi:hypothetical protein